MKKTLLLISVFCITFSSCDEIRFNECDCVQPTEKVLKHKIEGDSDWFIDLGNYCRKKGLGFEAEIERYGYEIYDQQKWNEALQNCK